MQGSWLASSVVFILYDPALQDHRPIFPEKAGLLLWNCSVDLSTGKGIDRVMKTDLDHLPVRKQRELAKIVDVLHAEFAQKLKPATTARRKNGKILKIILFGSYARGDWVEDRKGGYFSDYDILVVVNDKLFTEVADYWLVAEDRLLRDKSVKTVPQFIFHTLQEVNDALKDGQYFFFDIISDGVVVYDLKDQKPNGKPKHRFVTPTPPDAGRAYELAQKYCEQWRETKRIALENAQFNIGKAYYNKAAFELHQTAEAAYSQFLLTHTLYVPKDHHIGNLRTRAEDINATLRPAWPRGRRPFDRYFELLRRAYVEARYSEHYRITREELEWLEGCIVELMGLVDTACQEHLANLKSKIIAT